MTILTIFIISVTGIVLFVNFHPVFGGTPEGSSLTRIQNSPNFKDGQFWNLEGTSVMIESDKTTQRSVMKKFLFGFEDDKPKEPIKVVHFDKEKFLNADSGLTVIWFGHSTLLFNIGGKIVLTDPVFFNNASPVPFTNPAFKYTEYPKIQDLPELDIVVISHDHYDHLDRKSIRELIKKTKKFYVPLGVDAHLLKWGVPAEKIVIADWWDEFQDESGLKLIAATSRHFSGRGMRDRNKTLWCSWIIQSANKKIYFSGDSGYGSHYKTIGEKYGPFDYAALECGQYNTAWQDIHNLPEKTAQAAVDLKSAVFMPIHWGKFRLSVHPWYEPPQRAGKAADSLDIHMVQSKIGEILRLDNK